MYAVVICAKKKCRFSKHYFTGTRSYTQITKLAKRYIKYIRDMFSLDNSAVDRQIKPIIQVLYFTRSLIFLNLN